MNEKLDTPTPPQGQESSDNTLSILAHVLGLFTGFIGCLIIYLMAQDEQTKSHARMALNWQISLIIYMIVGFVLAIVLIGFLIIAVISIANLVFCIMAAVKASRGVLWRYPGSISFLKT